VTGSAPEPADQRQTLLAIYDRAVPQVYGYLWARTSSETLAEDLTAETFLAAVSAVERDKVPNLTVAWLVTVARNKLVDHWRRGAREERALRLVDDDDDSSGEDVAADLELKFERARAHRVLESLGDHHRGALTLRYLDGLSVPEVASLLGRTVHATEALLVRARSAFRATYAEHEADRPDRRNPDAR